MRNFVSALLISLLCFITGCGKNSEVAKVKIELEKEKAARKKLEKEKDEEIKKLRTEIEKISREKEKTADLKQIESSIDKSSSQVETGASVQVRGIRIVAPKKEGEDDNMRPFNWFPGTVVSIWTEMPDGGIIECDKDACKLNVFKDNKGKDMLAAHPLSDFGSSEIEAFPTIRNDKRACLFEVKVLSLPSTGATQLTTSGYLALKTAKKQEKFETRNIAITKGTKFQIGGFTMKIGNIGKPEWGGDYEFAVTIQSNQVIEGLASIKFYDDKGGVLECESGGHSVMKFGAIVDVNMEYCFKNRIDKATIVMTRWTDMKTQLIPFNLTFGIGF